MENDGRGEGRNIDLGVNTEENINFEVETDHRKQYLDSSFGTCNPPSK